MKQNPGKLSYATSGAGSSDHLTGELFKNVVGGFAVHIPYRGGAPAMPFIKGGKMKALMLTAAKPAPQLPDVPIGAKVGIPLEVTSWQALAAPAGTPPAIIQRLNEIAVKGMNAPDVKERMATQAFDIVANSPAEFSDFLKKEVARWKKAVKDSGAGMD
jgi:tripartite-type tricarboxylate transporter receptor subunit TctC